ncbi:histidine phosphatase family protein [Actinomadura rubrisoli]|uniref:Histidine phosphatase family protein n=1 Tax=Actinomadura rubrisoli TaxID=2530368 RepID=A0A4R5B8X0_9ACTN|nr:histidine phosphatase family protein [Actinomadura rubrisoli]TDD82768.1 hypothetical protein E1298_22245 [Actinomadura rubrisoli]
MRHSPHRVPAPGAESWNDFVRRIAAALSALVRAAGWRRCLVVAHGETVNAVHHVLWGLPVGWPAPLGLAVGHASVTRWRVEALEPARPDLGADWQLVSHNDVQRLPSAG